VKRQLVTLAIAIILPKEREVDRRSFGGTGKIGQRYCNHGANNGLQSCWLATLEDPKVTLAGMLSGLAGMVSYLAKHGYPFVSIGNKAGMKINQQQAAPIGGKKQQQANAAYQKAPLGPAHQLF
jgi:hypothetical protein